MHQDSVVNNRTMETSGVWLTHTIHVCYIYVHVAILLDFVYMQVNIPYMETFWVRVHDLFLMATCFTLLFCWLLGLQLEGIPQEDMQLPLWIPNKNPESPTAQFQASCKHPKKIRPKICPNLLRVLRRPVYHIWPFHTSAMFFWWEQQKFAAHLQKTNLLTFLKL